MTFAVTIERDADIQSLTPERVRKAIAERSQLMHTVFEEAGETLDHSKVTTVPFTDGHALAVWTKNLNDELTTLGARASEFDGIEAARANAERAKQYADGYKRDPSPFAPKAGGAQPQPFKGIGQAFVESDLYTAAKAHSLATQMFEDVDAKALLELKATFLTTSGWAPETLRTGRVVLDEQREIAVIDAFPLFPTNQAAIVYMEETTFTNAAAERAEEGAHAAATLILTERSVTVRSIGVSLPVTDEQLADVEGVRAYLDQRLLFMVRQRLDSQLLVGNGTAPNVTGTLNVAGINTQAKGTDSVPDAVYKGIDLVRVTGRAEPNVAIIHPTDWQAVRLLTTADGVYIWGSPSEAGPQRIWGLPVILTTAVTQNTGIVGDYARFAGLHVRAGVEVQTGYNNDDFVAGRQTIRAGIRVGVVHYRPSAFTQITGI